MENEKKTKIALVRGNSFNEWEGKLWEHLSGDFLVTGFCSKKNLYNTKNIAYPVKRLSCSSDNRLRSRIALFLSGRFQEMPGLEKELAKFDIAHTAEISYFYTTQAVRAKKLNPKLRVVCTVWDNSFGRFEYNYWPGFKTPPAFWRKRINSIIKENVDGVDMFLPVTDYSAQMLLDYGVDPKKIQIVTPAVIENGGRDEDIEERYGITDRDVYMTVNRMIKEKGVYDVLYAWKMYLRDHNDPKKLLLMIGNGPERENLMRLVSEWELRDRVKFITQVPNKEVRELYRYARCLILGSLPGPLWQEQFGYVLAEAMCAGCPVISTYSGAIPEVIGSAGLLFVPGNPADLKRILGVFDNEATHRELKDNCLKEKNKFSVDTFVQALTDVYNNLFV